MSDRDELAALMLRALADQTIYEPEEFSDSLSEVQYTQPFSFLDIADAILARWRLVPVNATDKQLAQALGMDTTQQVRRWSVTDEQALDILNCPGDDFKGHKLTY